MTDTTTRSRETTAETTGADERERSGEREGGGVRTTCPECGGRLAADERRGETACVDCGLVVDADEVDRGPDWRAFDAAERNRKSRVGAPVSETIHDGGLSTNIDWRDRDANGRALSSRQRRKMQRLRTWNERFRTTDAKDRNLKQALGEVDRMSSALGLPENVRETASVIYRRALEEDLLPGRSIEGVATACVYAGARQAGVPRSLDEVTAVSRVDRTEITRTYRYLLQELGLEVRPAEAEEFLPRVVSDLGLSDHLERTARELLSEAKGTGVYSGKSPIGLAAAAVYAASLLTDERTTQREVGEATDVSEVTIRNRYKQLLSAAGDDALQAEA